MRSVLIDTNVLAYAYDSVEIEKRASAVAVLRSLQSDGSGAISTQVACELYNTLTRKLRVPAPADEAMAAIAAECESWTLVGVLAEIALAACEISARTGVSVWDAQLLATAAHYGMRHVLSEDFEHRRVYGEVTVLDPFATDFDPAELAS